MGLKSICTGEVVTVDRDAPAQQAARLMSEHHVGSVVITQETAGALQVVGIVTDRDLAVEVVASGVDATRVTVGSLVDGRPLHHLSVDADVGDAVALMQSAGVRRLLVHDADGHLCGLLSFDDLLQAGAAQLNGLAAVLPRAVERESAQRPRMPAPPLAPRVRVPAMGTLGWAPAPGWTPQRPG